MVTIAVPEDVLEPIRKVAEQEGKDVESVVEDWLRRQLALVRESKIKEESARFRSKHAELRARYLGEYVAMRNGEVLDHDQDARNLYLRIKQVFGDEPVLIAPVTEQSVPEYQMRSPRLADSAP